MWGIRKEGKLLQSVMQSEQIHRRLKKNKKTRDHALLTHVGIYRGSNSNSSSLNATLNVGFRAQVACTRLRMCTWVPDSLQGMWGKQYAGKGYKGKSDFFFEVNWETWYAAPCRLAQYISLHIVTYKTFFLFQNKEPSHSESTVLT